MVLRVAVAMATVCVWGGPLRSAEVLINRGAGGWRYWDAPHEPAELSQRDGWIRLDYDDSTWPEGQATLGYGDADVATQLSFGADPQRKPTCALFRRRFNVVQRARFRLFCGRICCDDGAAVFVNGQEVYRCNLPSGRLGLGTRALSVKGPKEDVERKYHVFTVQESRIVEGENLIAVSVHQANRTSSDLAMDLELVGLTSEEEVAQLEKELDQQSKSQNETRRTDLSIAPALQFKLTGD